MLQHPTLDQLKHLKLHGMARAFTELGDNAQASELDHAQWLALLLDREEAERDDRRLIYRLRNARLRHSDAVIEDVDYRTPRRLDKALFQQLTRGKWIARKQNLIITGPCGVGKSWLACALGQKACRDDFSVLYKRWDGRPLPTASQCAKVVVFLNHLKEEASMEEISTIGIDLAKHSFQVHGARADGSVGFRKKLSRGKVLDFLASQLPCVVAMEACASAHYWGRETEKLGHEVKLVPPIYVKPFVKRQKNDTTDAEAICEAAQRPTMSFVVVKTEEQQARGMLFRTRDLLVRQRTQTINALRGHLAEFGVVAPQGPAHVSRLASALEDPGSGLPDAVRELGGLLLEQIADLNRKIGGLEKELRTCARQDEEAARLMTIPGVGPITAMAIQAFAPPMESFRRGRDLAAWLGLVPRQHTTGGKPRLGKISKMGQRDLRRLLIMGAMTVVQHAARRGETVDPWLARMLARKPKMLVAVALANRMARMIWALTTKQETYRAPATA